MECMAGLGWREGGCGDAVERDEGRGVPVGELQQRPQGRGEGG